MTESVVSVESKGFFSTYVHFCDLPDTDGMNAAMLERIRALKSADPRGVRGSNTRDLGGWHSENDLHKDPVFEPLRNAIGAMMGPVSDRLHLDPAFTLMLLEMWSIVNPPRSYNIAHLHPNSHFSGVYYIQAPENSGNLVLLDPRIEARMLPLHHKWSAPVEQTFGPEVKVEPKPGRLVIFPSWLMHRVDPNMSTHTGPEGDRVIVSFNMNQFKPR